MENRVNIDAPVPAKTIASLLNLTARRVQQLANESVITKASRGQYNLVASVQGYIKFLQEIAEGKGYTDEKGTSRSELDRARAKKATIEAAQAEASVLGREEVQLAMNTVMQALAYDLNGVSGRFAADVAAETDPAVIQDMIFEEHRRIRESAAVRIANLGGDQPLNIDTPASAKKNTGRVGRRKPNTATRKHRKRTLEKP